MQRHEPLIDAAWERRTALSDADLAALRPAIDEILDALEAGTARVAAPDGRIGMVDGVADIVQMGALGAQQALQSGVAGVHVLLAIIAAPHPRLVGDEEDVEAEIVGPPHRLSGTGQQHDALGVGHVAEVHVQRAIAVEEQRRPAGGENAGADTFDPKAGFGQRICRVRHPCFSHWRGAFQPPRTDSGRGTGAPAG